MRLLKPRNFLISTIYALMLASASQAQYKGSNLPLPSGAVTGSAVGIVNGEVAGNANVGTTPHALLWNGAANTVINLDPGNYGSSLYGITGTTQFGVNGASQYIYYSGGGRGGHIHETIITFWHAAIWNGSSNSMVDLNPFGETFSYVLGAYGNRQVGAAINAGPPLYIGTEYAYVWSGTAASAVDIGGSYTWTQANCVGPVNIGGVGGAYLGANAHAILWTGPSYTIVDLHPTAYPAYSSFMSCLDDSRNQQGGYLYIYNPYSGGYDYTAYLWNGTPNGQSLAPVGSTSSVVLGMFGGYQVGWAMVSGVQHAFVWHGSAASAIDLGPGSATGIDGNLDVVGTVNKVPVIWKLASINHLSILQTPEPNASGWVHLPVNFTIKAPFKSGTPSITYQWDSSASNTVSGASASTTMLSDGTHHLAVLGSNGTTTTWTNVLTVNVDTTPPKTVVKLAGGAFTLTAKDTGSGLAATYYSLDGGASTLYTGAVGVTNIVHNLKFWSVDNAGNVEPTRTVTLPIEAPSLTGVTPGYVYNGAADTTVTLGGADFDPTSVVLLNGTALTTTYVSSSQLQAVIPAADLTSPVTDSLTVKTPGANGGTSNAVTFLVLQTPDN